jgi:YidC/Oxa1 family membrane protein insertase
MNQFRTFLLIAWLMVAFLLWQEWGKEKTAAAQPAPSVPAAAQADVPGAPIPQAVVPSGAPVAPAMVPATAPSLRLSNDVLALELNGRDLTRAELLKYPQTREAGSPPVVLFDATPARRFVAEAFWRGSDGRELALQPQGDARDIALADGAQTVQAHFVADAGNGLQLQRTYTLARGSYAVRVRDELVNAGNATWNGDIERRLERVPPVVKAGFTNPESFSLSGAA